MQQIEGKMTLMLPPGVVYGVASSSSWSKSICNLDISITRIRRSLEDYCLLSKVNTLNRHGQAGLHLSPPKKGKLLGSHVVGWKYPVHWNTPTMIGRTIGG